MPDARGFVLLDRTVVVAVGFVVAIVLVIATRGADDRASAAACRQDATQVANAVDAYRARHADAVPDQQALVADRLLPHVSAMHRIVPEPEPGGYRIVPAGRCARG